jgi:hypothetical protein
MKTAKEILQKYHQYSSDNSKKMHTLITCMEEYADQFKAVECNHDFKTKYTGRDGKRLLECSKCNLTKIY